MWTDVLPLLLFFFFYKWQGIYAATGSAIVAGLLSALYRYRKERHVEPLTLFTLALICILGGLTIYLQDPRFLIWKPTIAYLATAFFFALSCRQSQTPLLERLLGSSLRLSPQQWRSGTWAYVIYFCLAAIANIIIGYSVSLDLWVKYKVFGTIILSMAFMLGHTLWISRQQLPEAVANIETASEAVISEP